MQELKEITDNLNKLCEFDFKKVDAEYADYICNKTSAKIYRSLGVIWFSSDYSSFMLCFNSIDFGDYNLQTFNGINLAFECSQDGLINLFKTSL
jgi:hypothetical protein